MTLWLLQFVIKLKVQNVNFCNSTMDTLQKITLKAIGSGVPAGETGIERFCSALDDHIQSLGAQGVRVAGISDLKYLSTKAKGTYLKYCVRIIWPNKVTKSGY